MNGVQHGQQESSPGRELPTVSVVIPAWNRRETLRMSVESVLRQTFTDFELIVVDDGSTDGTMEAIADLADPRIRRLAHETNKGVSAARNTGIRAAQGEWVAFQDSDDEWLPRKLEKQMARLEGAGPEVVACYCGMLNLFQTDAPDQRTSPSYVPAPTEQVTEGDLYETLLSRWLFGPQMLVVKQSALQTVGYFDESLPAHVDADYAIRLAQHGHFVFVDEPLVLRWLSGNSLMLDSGKYMAGLSKLVAKHQAEMAAIHPRRLARHHVVIAGYQRRQGDLPGARASLAAAARLQPFSLPIRLRQLRLLLPQRPR